MRRTAARLAASAAAWPRSGPIIALLGMLLPSPAQGQATSAFHEGPATALPDSLLEYRGDFSIAVRRRWRDEVERDLIARAESLYPATSMIDEAVESYLALLGEETAQRWRERFDASARLEGERWWWLDEGWALLPFALTGDAVQHLVDRMRRLSRSPPPAPRRGEAPWHAGSFAYSARVVEADGADGYVVLLDAAWRYGCGSLCGFSFTKTRRVIFDADGELVSVEGDGPPDYGVS